MFSGFDWGAPLKKVNIFEKLKKYFFFLFLPGRFCKTFFLIPFFSGFGPQNLSTVQKQKGFLSAQSAVQRPLNTQAGRRHADALFLYLIS